MSIHSLLKKSIGFLFFTILFSSSYADKPLENQVRSLSEIVKKKKSSYAGEFFGIHVPIGNYYFAKRVVATFNASWRPVPKDKEQLEELTWQELLLSYEAYRRGIQATDEEVDKEIDKTMKQEKVDFDWKKDEDAFNKWVKERLKEPPELFRNQIEHLVKLNKLRNQVIESIKPEVSEEEAYQKFLDEYNTLSVELVQFDDLKEAEEFYKNLKEPLSDDRVSHLVWEDLVLSYEANRRDITIDDKELNRALSEFFFLNDIRFNWSRDREKLNSYLKDNFGMDAEAFNKVFSKLVIVDKLREKIYAKEEPPIDWEVYNKFLRRNGNFYKAYSRFFNRFKVRNNILRFPSFNKAKEFYKKIKREENPWDDKKRKQPNLFKRPGFVSLDFLINIWKFKRADAYKMLDYTAGSFYQPSPIYKGYAVFKILKVRKAKKEDFEKRKEYYFNRVKMIKKYEGFKKWLKDLKEKANIKIYLKP